MPKMGILRLPFGLRFKEPNKTCSNTMDPQQELAVEIPKQPIQTTND